ncbi:hypothetical protein Taro_003603 [Colocasia esculenta]|uniref:Uncharacterized protein n=1 Tax=Colocasia esculenta TaxID=4460 RepID=A0A843TSB9_COLES|nr:hypothetical protein [Colocasia esculenta]
MPPVASIGQPAASVASTHRQSLKGRMVKKGLMGCVARSELLVAKELWNDHKKLIFFPVASAATCTDSHFEVDQRVIVIDYPN